MPSSVVCSVEFVSASDVEYCRVVLCGVSGL